MEFLNLLIALGLLTTLAALGFGLSSMARGGEYDQKHATQLMFARVGSQGITVILLLIALYLLNM